MIKKQGGKDSLKKKIPVRVFSSCKVSGMMVLQNLYESLFVFI